MNILILNGSPKGKNSVTMQYTTFIENHFTAHNFEVINISQQIHQIEKNEEKFNEIINKTEKADAVIWAFPVYVLLVPGQYKRFIELISERDKRDNFKDKYTAVITTSIHFYDHTANNYMRSICEDLEMKYVDYFSAHMNDLLSRKQQKKLINFAHNFFEITENKSPVTIQYRPVIQSEFKYQPCKIEKKNSVNGKKILIITDNTPADSNLKEMTDQFKNHFIEEIEEININEIDIKGGCLGCIQCGYDNTCIYEGKDEFNNFYETKVKKADIIILAGEIKDRYLSSKWKIFFDRSFYNNHAPVLIDKQLVYIISGSLSQIPDIRQIFEALSQIQRANITDFISDEYDDSDKIDSIIQTTADKTIKFFDKNIIRESTFLGVGGMKIFRDDIYGPLRFPFFADYRVYKKLGIFDFDHRKLKFKIQNNFFWLLTKIPPVREQIYKKEIIPGMIKFLKRVNNR